MATFSRLVHPPTMHHHQVFLNFRGDELRYGFVSHLVDAFERHGIRFFIDKLEYRGRNMTNLFLRINQSSIALAIFSTRYAESKWCLDELVEMKKCADEGKLVLIPIFYKVEARNVKAQTGKFGVHFKRQFRVSQPEQIEKWKEALVYASSKMGMTLRHKSSEAEFIKEIVKEVKRILNSSPFKENEDTFRHDNMFIELPSPKQIGTKDLWRDGFNKIYAS